MSWDVAIDAERYVPGQSDGASVKPLGDAEQIRQLVSAALPSVDWSDPAWGVLEGDGWTIEFNTSAAGIVQSIMLHVRGGGDPLPTIGRLCQETGWVATDMTTGEYLDPSNLERKGWMAFRGFRDRVAESVRAPERPARVGINWLLVAFAVLAGLAIMAARRLL